MVEQEREGVIKVLVDRHDNGKSNVAGFYRKLSDEALLKYLFNIYPLKLGERE